MYVILRFRLNKVKQIRQLLQQKTNIFNKKYEKGFVIFLEKNKDITLKYYDKIIELYDKEIQHCDNIIFDPNVVKSRMLPNKNKIDDDNLQVYHLQFQINVFDYMESNKNSIICFDQKKGLLRLLLEIFNIYEFNNNFKSMSKTKMDSDSWENYYTKFQLMRLTKIKDTIKKRIQSIKGKYKQLK